MAAQQQAPQAPQAPGVPGLAAAAQVAMQLAEDQENYRLLVDKHRWYRHPRVDKRTGEYDPWDEKKAKHGIRKRWVSKIGVPAKQPPVIPFDIKSYGAVSYGDYQPRGRRLLRPAPRIPIFRRSTPDLAEDPLDAWTDGNKKMDKVRGAAWGAATRLLQAPNALSFNKILGVGGHGAVALFERTDLLGLRRFCVAKMSLGPDFDHHIAIERPWLNNLRYAMHIIQRIPLSPFDTLAEPPAGSMESKCLVMEFCRRGDLYRMLGKMVAPMQGQAPVIPNQGPGAQGPVLSYTESDAVLATGPPIGAARGELGPAHSNRGLWHLFDCFFQMAMAMALPVRRRPDWDANNPRMKYEANSLAPPEWVPADVRRAMDPKALDPNATAPAMNFIHFDIDPGNVLVADDNTDQVGDLHKIFPLLKLNDFGIAENVTPRFKGNREQMINSKRMAKEHFFAPEQFTEEWEWWFNPGHEPANLGIPNTAGQYSWKTNMWSLAYVMWTIICKCRVPAYPIPELQSDPRDPATKEQWTFGPYIQEDSDRVPGPARSVDPDLRALVGQCLCHDPDDRPDIAHIRRMLKWKLGPSHNWPESESDDNCRKWVDHVFNTPMPPAALDQADLNAWLADRVHGPKGSLHDGSWEDNDGNWHGVGIPVFPGFIPPLTPVESP